MLDDDKAWDEMNLYEKCGVAVIYLITLCAIALFVFGIMVI